MALVVNIKLLGSKELERGLIRLAEKDQKKVMRKALRAGAKRLKKLIEPQVPISEEDDKGTLKRSGRIRAMKRSRTRIGVQVVYGGPDAPYAAHVELGTSNIRPQPFMRQPANNYRRPFVADISGDLRTFLNRFRLTGKLTGK